MKTKVILPGFLVLILSVITLILLFIPASATSAQEGMEYVADGSILKKYTASGNSFEIPKGITEIGPEAFKNSTITDIVIPSTVKRIDEQAFYGCDKLNVVYMESGVKELMPSCFANCKNLEAINIPESVGYIGPGIFAGCTSLSDVDVSPNNTHYFYNDGVIYNSASTTLIQYLPGRKSTSYEMPFTVEKINKYAFWGASLLTNVRISNNVKEIPFRAFSNCVGLTSIFLPESVTKIGSYGFSDCKNLNYVGMEANSVNIADTAFYGCGSSLDKKQGVSESEAMSAMGYNDGSGDLAEDDSENAEVFVEENNVDIKSARIKKAGVDKDGNTTYNKVFLPGEPPKGDISMQEDGIIGATKVSGGKAFIIPEY